jgi:hypothetical protein
MKMEEMVGIWVVIGAGKEVALQQQLFSFGRHLSV